MRRLVVLCLLAVAAQAADDLGRTLRALKADDRERRRAALSDLAEGRVEAVSKSEQGRAEVALARFLSDRILGTERALAVRALGRLRRPRVYAKLLDRVARETDDRVLEAAEAVFAEAPAALATDVAQRIARAKTPLARAALLRVLGVLPGPEARRRIRARAGMADHWAPRAVAAHALARDHTEAAYPPLIELLDTSDPALLTAAVESLTQLTKRRYGREVAQWKTWWATRDKVAPLEEAIEKARKPGERVYAHETERRTIAPFYFGLPIQGKKVVFVFDVSASMRYKLPLAYEQLVRAVKGLPSATRFEVIFFNEFVWPWRGRLSRADPLTKELLVRHLPSIEIKSYTNLFDSIEKALALQPAEIFVISDGAPNRGRRRLPRDILKELKRLNTKGVKIHTISVVRVVDGDEHISLLERIAKDHRGSHVQRTLR